MATQISAYAALEDQLGLRVAVCEPDPAVRAQLRAAIDADPLLVLAAESHRWADCEACLDEVVPELLIVRSELLPSDWSGRDVESFAPVVIALRTTLSFPGDHQALRVPADAPTIKATLDRAVHEVYQRKAEQLLFLVDRYVQGSQAVSPYKTVLRVEHDGMFFDLSSKDILSISAARKHVWIRSTQGEFLLREPIHEVSERLDPRWFVRIHRSVIVNLRYLDANSPVTEKSSYVLLGNGARYPVGPNYREALAEALRSSGVSRLDLAIDASFVVVLTSNIPIRWIFRTPSFRTNPSYRTNAY